MALLDLKLRKGAPHLNPIAVREFPESDFIPYACHFDDHTILTKSGDLLQIIKINGLEFETVDEDFLCFRKNLRNTLFRSVAKHGIGVYVHTVRRKLSVFPEGRFDPGFTDQLNSAWKEKHSRLKLFVNDFYLTIIQRPQRSPLTGIQAWLNSLSRRKI